MKRRPHVLIVDDRYVVRETLRNILFDFSCIFLEAANGAHALELIRDRDFDIIFLDLKLPDCSGIDVLSEARSIDKPLGRVIILTGFPEPGSRAEAESLGAFRYLTKPPDWDEIRDVFSQAVPVPSVKKSISAPSEADKPLIYSSHSRDQGLTSTFSRPRLLVLDDQRSWLNTTEQVLGTEFDLTLTTNIGEACRLVSRVHFELVVLDMRLVGGVTGLDVLSRMRRMSPDLRAIILTGYPDFKSASESGRRGAIDYVSKSDVSHLSERIRMILSENTKPTRIFLSYDRRDKAKVTHIYHRLIAQGFLPWMDIKNIMAGVWEPQIRKAIRDSDYFIFLLSHNSIYKEGILRKELRQALERQEGLLDDSIFLITALLEDVEVAEPLSRFYYIDLFKRDGFQRLLRALSSGSWSDSKNLSRKKIKEGLAVEDGGDT